MATQPQVSDDEAYWNRLDVDDRDTRIDVAVDALLYCATEQPVDIVIQNLSVHGIRATSDFPPCVGEAVDIEMAGLGRFKGVVRWQHQNRFGVHTFESIDLSVFSDREE